MNELTVNNDVLAMSSLEIAELCGKHHKNVLQDIRSMLNQLEIGALDYELSYKSQQNKSFPLFELPKDLTLTLVSGYSVKLRKRIIDRWLELEGGQVVNRPAELSRMDLIMLAKDAEEENVELRAANSQLEHKVESIEKIFDMDGSECVTTTAKSLRIKPGELFDWLKEHHWIFERRGSRYKEGYQDKVDAGYLTHRTRQRKNGKMAFQLVPQVRITTKGLAKLSELIQADKQKRNQAHLKLVS